MRVDEALREVIREHAKSLASAEWFVVAYDDDMIGQSIPVIQMGLAVYLDKPIVVVAPIGAVIPMNLKRLALRVVEYDAADDSSLTDAIVRIRRAIVQ
jgi:hypothetical protein